MKWFYRLLFLFLLCLALRLSDHSVLIWETTSDVGRYIPTLRCTYFTGFSVYRKEYLEGTVLGRKTCPGVKEND